MSSIKTETLKNSKISSNEWQRSVFGCSLDDFKTWKDFVRLMNRPEDPSSLAIFRIAFGFLMILDIPHERSFAYVDHVFGSTGDICKFPLFDFLRPLPVLHMSTIYCLMLFGAIGICLGCCYRLSSIIFTTSYCYVFLLDKTTWNNHSYLYGLIGSMMCVFDAHNFWSIHGIHQPAKRNAHVPLWNYFILRTQIFLVYFIAGLKKTEYDWLAGYSFDNLGEHWVFAPFRLILSTKLVTWLVIHGSGFIIDFFVGFFLFFDKTRLIGTIIVSSFHLMNSQIFAIGVFPWTMLASTALFYSNSWPKQWISNLTKSSYIKSLFRIEDNIKYQSPQLMANPRCIYNKEHISKDKAIMKNDSFNLMNTPIKATRLHNLAATLSISYVLIQIFLPYSHFITKGYNGWTQGLYGYSWDMMVHSWHTQHVKISVLNKDTGELMYLNPRGFTSANRWSSHPDMIKQHALCIADYVYVKRENWTNISINMDIWRSMNGRFIQRQVHPHVDLVTAEWSPFKTTGWIVPLLQNLSEWRNTLRSLEDSIRVNDSIVELTFVSDLPGLCLDNYVESQVNTLILVLDGEIVVEFKNQNNEKSNISLQEGLHTALPAKSFHKVYTVSSRPSCFLYIYRNETENSLIEAFKIYKDLVLTNFNKSINGTLRFDKHKESDLYHLNIPNYQGKLLVDLWQRKMYHNIAKIKLETALDNLSDKDFLLHDSRDFKFIKKSILQSLNMTIDEFSETPIKKCLTVVHNVGLFIKEKSYHYRRTLYVIMLTFRCLITGESLEKLLLSIHDYKFT